MSYGLHEELARLAARGDNWAWWELCNQFQRLIAGTAAKMAQRTKSMTREDITQEARIVLLDLAKTFRSDQGMQFSTYVIRWTGVHVQRQVDNIDRTIYTPSNRAIAHRTTVINGGDSILPTSFDIDEMSEDYVSSFLDTNGADSAYRSTLAAEALRHAEQLEDNEKIVLTRYLVNEDSFEEISHELGCSRQGAINVYHRAIKKLREWMQSDTDESPIMPTSPSKRTKQAAPNE